MSILGLVLLSSYLRSQKQREEIYEPILATSGLLTNLPGRTTSQFAVPEVIQSAIIVVLLVIKAKENFL